MRLLVCAAASILLAGADALALDDTPTQAVYVPRHEAVRTGAPLKRQAVAAVSLAKPPASPVQKRAPLAVLAQQGYTPAPCRAASCAPDFNVRGRIGGSP